MEAVLQFDLSDLSSCTVSVIKVFLYYNTTELTLTSIENLWKPHHGNQYDGSVLLTYNPVDDIDSNIPGYNNYTIGLYTQFIKSGFSGTSWSLQDLMKVTFSVTHGAGDLGYRMETQCGDATHHIPSPPPNTQDRSIFRVPFTTDWNVVGTASPLVTDTFSYTPSSTTRRRRTQQQAQLVRGDIDGNGRFTVADTDLLIDYYLGRKTRPNLSSLTQTQRMWLDHNRDGEYNKGGDVTAHERVQASQSSFPEFKKYACPSLVTEDLVIEIDLFGSQEVNQRKTSSLGIAVEVQTTHPVDTWSVTTGSSISSSSFLMDIEPDSTYTLRIRPQDGWIQGDTVSAAYLIYNGDRNNAKKRVIFGGTSLASQVFRAMEFCTITFPSPSPNYKATSLADLTVVTGSLYAYQQYEIEFFSDTLQPGDVVSFVPVTEECA